MKPIDVQDYFDLVVKGFSHIKPRETEKMTVFTEDIFKLQWLTRVRFNSFVTLADELDARTFYGYVLDCQGLAKRGSTMFGEPYVCNVVAICDNADQAAIDYALKRPPKNPRVNTYPVIVDLKKQEVHYYTGPIFYGVIYAKFEREYIDGHFALPLKALAGTMTTDGLD